MLTRDELLAAAACAEKFPLGKAAYWLVGYEDTSYNPYEAADLLRKDPSLVKDG